MTIMFALWYSGPSDSFNCLDHSKKFDDDDDDDDVGQVWVVYDFVIYECYGDRAFPVATVRVWNSLPEHVIPASHFLFFVLV